MKALRSHLLLVAAGLAAMPVLASAAVFVPDPNMSVVDAVGVGDVLGVAQGPAPRGFDVEVNDSRGAPNLGAMVTLDFSQTSVRAFLAQNAGTMVNAAARTLSRVATTGRTNFAARTGGFDNSGLVRVSADGILLRIVPWRSLDFDATDQRVSLSDLVYLVRRYLAGTVAPECNFVASASDAPDLADLSMLADGYLASGIGGAYAW